MAEEPSASPSRRSHAAGPLRPVERVATGRPALQKIVSGGQTGVDRAALDAAIHGGIAHGGWCPSGRRAEDGPIATRYRLKETDSSEYAVRTDRNVVDSDATLILTHGPLSGGTKLTAARARFHGRPLLVVDLDEDSDTAESLEQVTGWLGENSVKVLNVAGPRESTSPGETSSPR